MNGSRHIIIVNVVQALATILDEYLFLPSVYVPVYRILPTSKTSPCLWSTLCEQIQIVSHRADDWGTGYLWVHIWWESLTVPLVIRRKIKGSINRFGGKVYLLLPSDAILQVFTILPLANELLDGNRCRFANAVIKELLEIRVNDLDIPLSARRLVYDVAWSYSF